MRFHRTGLVVFALLVLLAVVGGAVPAVAVLRIAFALFFAAALVEIVVNMIRHHDMHVRSRLLSLVFLRRG